LVRVPPQEEHVLTGGPLGAGPAGSWLVRVVAVSSNLFVTSHRTKINGILFYYTDLFATLGSINNRFQPSIPASSAMTISRVLSIAARRAPVARSSVVANVAHRGFAVAACQQLHNSRGESATSPRVGALLAAASAAMGASAVLGNDHAECCGIAGVVGGSGDAR
jgi:hypothetical protein